MSTTDVIEPSSPQPTTMAGGPPPPPRPGVRRAWIVAGSIMAVAALGWGTLNVISLLAYERIDRQVVFDGPIRVIEVRGSGGSVQLSPSADDRVVVDVREWRGLSSPDTSEAVEGDRLVLSADCSSFINAYCRVRYAVTVPAGVDVQVRSSGGGISARGLDGDLDLSSSGGGVRVEGASGRLRLDSSGGGVTAVALTSAQVDASSSGGAVRVSFAQPPLSVAVDSSGGGVTVEVPDTPDAYRVDASSSGGSTHNGLRVDPTSDRTIRARSSGGSVTLRYPGP